MPRRTKADPQLPGPPAGESGREPMLPPKFGESVYFVYRIHYEAPSGRHVRRLPGRSVLEWFRDAFDRAAAASDPTPG
jgi:hypothetical protein